ncbi:hypothetical protein GJAV_G00197840 [Gymnothorax javanicus]|nr:hypothetical protein GJAV_G00197840 [Gymnothorax javanicus]
MKPPSRKRTAPRRFEDKGTEERRQAALPVSWNAWSEQERRVLLAALGRQDAKYELDLEAIKAKIPKRSIHQIESFVQFLKGALGRKVVRLVSQLRSSSGRDRVPIQLWTEMAEKMAGSRMVAISSAFSQIFVIASTEPCSLLNSVPPLPLSAPLGPKQQMGRPRSSPLLSGKMEEWPQSKCQMFSDPCSQTAVRFSIGNLPCSSQSPLPNEVATSLSKNTQLNRTSASKGSLSLASPHPSHPTASLNQSSSNQGIPTPESSQPAEQSAGSDTSTSTEGQEQQGHSSSSTSMTPMSEPQTGTKITKMDFDVNFENIYRFLSCAAKLSSRPDNMPPLSRMESAVVLDLLLSLPEQIPLLDCVELQDQVRQVHEQLSAPLIEAPQPEDVHQETQSHLTQAADDAGVSSLQGDTSTNQEGERLDQSESSVPSVHTDGSVSDARTESVASGSSHVGQSGVSQSLTSQESAGQGKDGNKMAADQSSQVEPASSTEAAVPSTSAMRETAAPTAVGLAVGAAVQTTQQSASMSDVPSPSQNTEQEKTDIEVAALCPLNPFMIPMKLLAQTQSPVPVV